MGMDELVAFSVEGTAEWREKVAVDHPDDSDRNIAAANMLTKLVEGLRKLEGSTLHQKLDALLTGGDPDLDFSAIISQASRDVGFRRFPKSAEEFLDELIDDLDRSRSKTNGVVALPEPLAHDASDRAYVAPRFPNGIRSAVLSLQPLETQRHVILYWFIRNFEPAAFDRSAPFSSPQHPDVRVPGFDQTPFFGGGTADRFLITEFDGASKLVLSEIASALPGLWMLRLPQPPAADASARDRRTTLISLLDTFDDEIRKLPAASHERWDNNPPESERLPDTVLAFEVRDAVLHVTADMRLAVEAKDYSTVAALWDEMQPVLAEVATYLGKKLDSALDAAVKVVGGAVGALVLIEILTLVGILAKGDAISAFLRILQMN